MPKKSKGEQEKYPMMVNVSGFSAVSSSPTTKTVSKLASKPCKDLEPSTFGTIQNW